MRKPLLLSFILILLLVGTSCKRLYRGKVVEGQVVDSDTKRAIPYAYVQVYQADSAFKTGYSKVGDPHRTDGEGRFSFGFRSNGSHVLLAYTNDGHYTLLHDAIPLKKRRNNKDLQVFVNSPGWVKVHLINEAPFDSARIYVHGFYEDEKGQTGLRFNKLKQDTSFIRAAPGNMVGSIAWRITKSNGQEIFEQQDAHYIGMDTIDFNIRY